MPRKNPILDYTQIRNYAERWEWIDMHTGRTETGFNPPSNAVGAHRVPFSITFFTENGMPYKGRAVCISANTAQHTRLLQFVDDAIPQIPCMSDEQRRTMFNVIKKGEIRQVSDVLILAIDGVRFSAH